jgi:hypothetical protein
MSKGFSEFSNTAFPTRAQHAICCDPERCSAAAWRVASSTKSSGYSKATATTDLQLYQA